MTSTILLVDDEVKIRRALGAALRDEGYEVVEAAGGLDARRLLGQQPYDALVVDNLMPDMTGLDLIRELSASVPDGDRPQILMMTAHATVDSAIEAMKLGAFDYLQKPFDVDELLVVVRRALEHQRLRTQHRYLLNEQREAFNQYGIVARSARMQEVIRTAELVAESRSTVLITGETGTGKELVARAIHDRSGQREMPLIKVNCAAIPDNLLESELFGHRRGAFTGALVNKKGRFELANGGTIFLDEIGTMSLGAAGQAAARPAGTGVRAARRGADPPGRRPRHCRHEPGSRAARVRRRVRRRPVLPPERHPDRDSAAPRTTGGHSALLKFVWVTLRG